MFEIILPSSLIGGSIFIDIDSLMSLVIEESAPEHISIEEY